MDVNRNDSEYFDFDLDKGPLNIIGEDSEGDVFINCKKKLTNFLFYMSSDKFFMSLPKAVRDMADDGDSKKLASMASSRKASFSGRSSNQHQELLKKKITPDSTTTKLQASGEVSQTSKSSSEAILDLTALRKCDVTTIDEFQRRRRSSRGSFVKNHEDSCTSITEETKETGEKNMELQDQIGPSTDAAIHRRRNSKNDVVSASPIFGGHGGIVRRTTPDTSLNTIQNTPLSVPTNESQTITKSLSSSTTFPVESHMNNRIQIRTFARKLISTDPSKFGSSDFLDSVFAEIDSLEKNTSSGYYRELYDQFRKILAPLKKDEQRVNVRPSSNVFLLIDHSNNVEYISSECIEIFGITQQEIIGCPLNKLVLFSDRENLAQKLSCKNINTVVRSCDISGHMLNLKIHGFGTASNFFLIIRRESMIDIYDSALCRACDRFVIANLFESHSSSCIEAQKSRAVISNNHEEFDRIKGAIREKLLCLQMGENCSIKESIGHELSGEDKFFLINIFIQFLEFIEYVVNIPFPHENDEILHSSSNKLQTWVFPLDLHDEAVYRIKQKIISLANEKLDNLKKILSNNPYIRQSVIPKDEIEYKEDCSSEKLTIMALHQKLKEENTEISLEVDSSLKITVDRSIPFIKSRKASVASTFVSGSMSPNLNSTEPSIKDFEIIKPISRGAFGSVYLSKKRTTGEYFAIKILKKNDMVSKNQITNVKKERQILSRLDSPFVVKLYFSFQSKNNLYLVMEYLNGGDCGTLIKAMGVLDEAWSKKYAVEIVLALEYLHFIGVIHRDLKPENLLIDHEGHLKLTDFGLSQSGFVGRKTNQLPKGTFSNIFSPTFKRKSILGNFPQVKEDNVGSSDDDSSHSPLSRRRGSFASIASDILQDRNETQLDQKMVGTPDYLAPECITGSVSGHEIDWWALGIIMFEFVNGIPPFHAENPQKIFQKILAGKFKFDKHIKLTKNYKNIVKKFLALDPLLRLGSSGSGDVKKQKLFSEVLWEKVLKQEPHFVPTIDKQEDTSYFDPRGILNTEDDESTSESEKDNCTSPLGLSEEVKISFGQFSFKNISVIEKANKDVAKKLQQDSSAKNSPVLTKKEFKIKNAIDLTIQTPASVDLGPNSFELTSPENLNFPDTISMPFKERIQRKSSTGEVPSPEYHNKYANGKEHDLKSYPSSSENSFSLEPVSEARNNTPASPSPCFNGTRQRRSFSFGGPIRSPLREQQTSSTNVSFNIRRKAMIVDSNPLTFQVLEKLLKSYDFQCYYSKNGVGAMSYILNSTFDIIFADVDADSINGCVLANIVRTTENLNSKTPIIGLTSYSIQDNPDIKYLDDFIFKPFNTTSFKPLLDRHLEI